MVLNEEILARVAGGHFRFIDPCVICGLPFGGPSCGHTQDDTQPVIKEAQKVLRDRAKKKA